MALYIDGEKVTIAEAKTYLGVDIPRVEKQNRIFRFSRITEDRENGGFRYNRSIGGVPKFVVLVEGKGFVTVRYAISQIKKKDSEPDYSPKSLFLLPDEQGNVVVQDDLEFIYWFLNPMNGASPFAKKGKNDYSFYDKNKIANEEIKHQEELVSAMSIIFGDNAWNILKLRQFAKGLRMAGVDSMGDAVLKSNLSKLANKDPHAFYQKTQQNASQLNGLIQDAIDKKILQLKSVNGLKRWYLSDEEILPITYGEDETEKIFDYITEKFHVYVTKIKDLIAGKVKTDRVNSSEFDHLFDDNKVEAYKDDIVDNAYTDAQRAKDVLSKSEFMLKVDEDENYRERIVENLKKEAEQGDRLHHATKAWMEEHAEAINYYKEKYADVDA